MEDFIFGLFIILLPCVLLVAFIAYVRVSCKGRKWREVLVRTLLGAVVGFLVLLKLSLTPFVFMFLINYFF